MLSTGYFWEARVAKTKAHRNPDVFESPPHARKISVSVGRHQRGPGDELSLGSPFKQFEFKKFWDIGPSTSGSYLVKGLMPQVGLIVIWGPPKCFKSFWTLDISLHVALGWTYRGRRVRRGPVVYIALEGASGYGARIEAFRRAHSVEPGSDIPFYLLSTQLDLVADSDALIAAIHENLGSNEPVAIFVDTLNRSLSGSESSDQDMSAYVRAADSVKDEFNCAVAVVHHCGINESRPRGHTSLTGAADAQIAITRTFDDNCTSRVEWLKDGEEGTILKSRLKLIEIGTDDDGESLSSCILEPFDDASACQQPASATSLPRAAYTALQALREAIERCAETTSSTAQIPPGTLATTMSLWRAAAYSRGISRSSSVRAKQQAFKRACELLVQSGKVSIWGDHVWIND